MKSILIKNWLLVLAVFLIFFSCKTKSTANNSNTGNDYNINGLNKNYNWTGTYELTDNTILYTLKLHKRSVDGSYEMQFFSNDKNVDLLKSSIYDAKDDSANIYIKYLNNFQMDAKSIGFKSGDTLFILHKNDAKSDSTIFKSFKPSSKNLTFVKTDDLYN